MLNEGYDNENCNENGIILSDVTVTDKEKDKNGVYNDDGKVNKGYVIVRFCCKVDNE